MLIDAYHSNTRSSTTEVRKQLAHLDVYMKDVARGDVTKLCTHTRSLLYELNAAGETTKDLVTNLISALEKAPDAKFQRYFSTQVDLWSMKQKNWKEDGSDLMEEAEFESTSITTFLAARAKPLGLNAVIILSNLQPILIKQSLFCIAKLGALAATTPGRPI